MLVLWSCIYQDTALYTLQWSTVADIPLHHPWLYIETTFPAISASYNVLPLLGPRLVHHYYSNYYFCYIYNQQV